MAEEVKATKKNLPENNVDTLREKVPFFAFKDGDKYKDDITVCVNGKVYRVKRGVQVMIPRFVYDVLMQSMCQDRASADFCEAKSNEYASETRRLGM